MYCVLTAIVNPHLVLFTMPAVYNPFLLAAESAGSGKHFGKTSIKLWWIWRRCVQSLFSSTRTLGNRFQWKCTRMRSLTSVSFRRDRKAGPRRSPREWLVDQMHTTLQTHANDIYMMMSTSTMIHEFKIYQKCCSWHVIFQWNNLIELRNMFFHERWRVHKAQKLWEHCSSDSHGSEDAKHPFTTTTHIH